MGLLQLLTVVHARLHRWGERINQLFQIKHLNHSPFGFMLMECEKHGKPSWGWLQCGSSIVG